MPDGDLRRPTSRFATITPYLPGAALALVVGALVAIMLASRRDGHWWGDDWSLYIRQAEGLLDGNSGAVADDNQFTIESSEGGPFSPPLYPWGFPLLLAPAIAILGRDIDQLAIVPMLSAVVFACCWYLLAKPRLGTLPAIISVVAVTITPVLLGWTELIQSEWSFLAATGVALVGIDRVAAAGGLARPDARRLPLILLGLATFAAFSIRREGLAVVAAIAAAQLAALIAAEHAPWRLPRDELRSLVARLLTPHVTALAGVLAVKWLMPSTLVPRYDGTGLGNIWKFAGDHLDHLAEVSGLKRPWDSDPIVLGSNWLGWAVVVVFWGAAGAGIALALTRRRTRDLHLLVYAVTAFMIGASFRGALNRYVVTVAPILMLLALTAVMWFVRSFGRPKLATALVTLIVAAIAAGNLANANVRVNRATSYAETGTIEWGPTHPSAIEMFEFVRDHTDDSDVIAAPKARAMTLLTDRRSVQVDDYRSIPGDVEITFVVTLHDGDVAGELAADTANYELVWSNNRFRVFQPRSSASAATNGAGSSSTASP